MATTWLSHSQKPHMYFDSRISSDHSYAPGHLHSIWPCMYCTHDKRMSATHSRTTTIVSHPNVDSCVLIAVAIAKNPRHFTSCAQPRAVCKCECLIILNISRQPGNQVPSRYITGKRAAQPTACTFLGRSSHSLWIFSTC